MKLIGFDAPFGDLQLKSFEKRYKYLLSSIFSENPVAVSKNEK